MAHESTTESVAHAPTDLEYPACPLCQSDRREFPFRLSAPYGVVRCAACGGYYLYPRLIESAMQAIYRESSYYAGGESGYGDTSYRAQESALRATFQRFLRNLVKRKLTGGDLLEVGCGYGYLLDLARPFFSSRTGTDFSSEAAAIARTTEAEVFVGGVEQLPSGAKFDCVLATQVIEHIYDPLRFVKRLVSHTKAGGHIVLATPDIGGALRKVLGTRWPSFKVPEHVIYYDFNTLGLLLQQAGLDDIRRIPYPHAFPFSLIGSKFGLPLPSFLGHLKVWVPATCVAAYGRVPNE
ncbi:MAG TPA: class I SAM-dependent methyltransferase [Chthoniobacterales bacterium]